MQDSIWSPKAKHMPPNQGCVKIPYKGYEISIAMDDSCGAFDTLRRSDIRVFRESDDQDVSALFLADGENMLYGEADTLKRIFSVIDELEK